MTEILKGRPVWHRIRLVPGDDPKDPFLALIQRWFFPFFRMQWNFADNPRRKEMQRAVDAWYQLEDAMTRIKEYEKDNEEAVKYAQHYRKREGVSVWYQSKRLPREELMPIPHEFGEVRKRFEQAIGAHQGRRKPKLNPDATGPLTRYVPEGVNLPELSLEGKEFKDHPWDMNRARQQQQQNQGRRKGKNPQQQNQSQQHREKIEITLPDQRYDDS